MRNFDSFFIGEKAELSKTITLDDIQQFVQLSGDDNKLHVDREFAQKTSFKKPVAHGMIGTSFISNVIGTKLPGDGALWFSQTIDFLLPAREGDTLTVQAEVIEIHNREKILTLKTEIYNQNKKLITTGIAKVKFIELLDEENLKNCNEKKALVIGASGGIGYATAIKLAKEGFELILHYNKNRKTIETLQNELKKLNIKTYIVSGNLLTKDGIETVVESVKRNFGKLTHFVNCSTTQLSTMVFEKNSIEDLYMQLDINIKSNFLLVQKLLPLFSLNYGKIVFLSTIYTDNPPKEMLSYVTAKSALEGFAKSLAIELANRGIRVNVVSAGMTDTDLIADVPKKTKLLTVANTPLKKIAQPNDIANSIWFLLSENSDHITGEIVRVNGGQVMR